MGNIARENQTKNVEEIAFNMIDDFTSVLLDDLKTQVVDSELSMKLALLRAAERYAESTEEPLDSEVIDLVEWLTFCRSNGFVAGGVT